MGNNYSHISKEETMITVRIECSLVRHGSTIESCPKVYVFDTMAEAEKFANDVNELPQHPEQGNFLKAIIVQETAYLTQDATPLFLHEISLTDPVEGETRMIDYHGTDVYTVAEIEDFRNTGKHSAIVYAYDNPNCTKPAVLTAEEFEESKDGGNYYFGDEDEEFFLSFNPEIVEMIQQEYCV